MFSRLYKSARSIFTESEEIEITQLASPALATREDTMVTTRQRESQTSAGDSLEDEDTINVYVPTSSGKRQRMGSKGTSSSEEDEADFAPPSSRKGKRLPVRAKDVDSPDLGKTRPVVEIPVKNLSPSPNHVNTVVGAEEGEAEEEEEDTNVKNEEHNTEATGSIIPKNHLRFGSEEVRDEFFSTAREVMNDEVEDPRVIQDSDDSEDDAPEAVGIQNAAKSVQLKDDETAKAVKDQLLASRKKRKARNEALKQQAESSKKRKLEDDITNHRKKTEDSAKEEREVSSKIEEQNPDQDESPVVAAEVAHQKDASKPLISKRGLPDILPAEYLEDAEPRDLLPFDQFPIKKAKKTKFHPIAEKQPKDRRVGSTTYRVTKASSTTLAPKSSSHARNMKDSWLQGRSGTKIGTNRTSFTKGFFKK